MSTLGKRVRRLEVDKSQEALVVLIHSWDGEAEYHGVQRGDTLIRRNEGEDQDTFVKRAEAEILAEAEKEPGFSGWITCFAVRETEMPAA